MGPFGGNGEECGRYAHWVPSTDHGEASEVVRIRDMGDAWGGRSAGGSGNEVGDDLQRNKAGNRGTVGGATPTI